MQYDVAVVAPGQARLALGHVPAEREKRLVILARRSALLGFVADEAAFIAGRIDGDREPSAGRSTDLAPQAAGATKGAF